MRRYPLDSIENFTTALMPHAATRQNDMPDYTSIKPVIQINEVLISRSHSLRMTHKPYIANRMPDADTFFIAAFARRLAIIALALLLTACAGPPKQLCQDSQEEMVSDLLYFGTAKPGGVVSAHEWQQFIDREITRRFPQGLTTWQASGQWQLESGPIVREPSYILSIVHPDNAATEAAVNAIMTTYKNRFRQAAVLRVRGNVCVSF